MIPSTAKGKKVKNLGWLLRHWKEVESFTVKKHPEEQGRFLQPDAHLIAHLKDGSTYETGFEDKGILKTWLDRPVFRGLTIKWEIKA